MVKRVQLKVDAERPMRHAVEIRNETFLTPAFVDMLRKYDVALVIAETARKWPMTQDITADFVYMRLHGDKELYKSGYSDKSLDRWAKRISAWQKGSEPADAEKISPKAPPTKSPRDVFCFFDNTDVKLRAPFDAQTLMDKLGIPKRAVPAQLAQPSPGEARQHAITPAGAGTSARTSASRLKAVKKRPAGTRGEAARVEAVTKRPAGTRGEPARGKAVTKQAADTRGAGARTAGARQTVRAVSPRKTAASASRRRAATGSRRSSARS
jgi:hypothetical protein